MMRFGFILPAAFLLFSCGSEQPNAIPPAGDPPPGVSSGPSGRIRGLVRLQGPAPAAAFEPTLQDQGTCGDQVPVSRLMLGKENGVRHAFVYLEGVQSAERFRARESLLVDQKNCQYIPHSLVVPAGSKLEVTNSDSILHNVHGHQITDQGSHTLFNIAQPVRGQRTTVDSPLSEPGIVFLTCEAGHPWMSAYVFVANHPYVALTNENGEFVIEGIPVGTYRIKMWHEGVTLKRNIKSLQRYEYEDPYEVIQEVNVNADGEAVVNFDLALRSTN
jgi:plastocyanin